MSPTAATVMVGGAELLGVTEAVVVAAASGCTAGVVGAAAIADVATVTTATATDTSAARPTTEAPLARADMSHLPLRR